MKTILFATDFSETCDNALEYLKSFVADSGLVVSIINVFDLQVASPSSIPTPSYDDWVTKKKDRLEKKLEAMMNQLPIRNRGAIEAIFGMMPATDISKEVKAYSPDLVVMGLRAKHTIVDKLVGTVTAQTIKKIDVPVLAIPFGAKYKGLDNILYPTVLSSPGAISNEEESSLENLLDMGQMFNSSKVEMLNIKESKSTVGLDVTYKNHPIEGLDYVVSEAKSIEQGIQDSIKDKSVDLLLVKKSKSNFWSRIFGSSVTRKLMMNIKIPVIVFQ